MESICKVWKGRIEDAKFLQGASSGYRKGKMQMQLYMTGSVKSICKFKEKQVEDTLV